MTSTYMRNFAKIYDTDGGDQEAAYCDEVTAMVTCDPAELIVDTWLDGFTLGDERWAKTDAERMVDLRKSLLFGVRAVCTELEMAENAARLEGGQSFSEWLEERYAESQDYRVWTCTECGAEGSEAEMDKHECEVQR